MMFKGKLVAITGAAGGIGQSLCRYFGAEGAAIAAIDRSPKLTEFVSELTAEGIKAGCAITDIGDGSSNTLMIFEVAWRGLELSPGSLRAWPRGCNWTSDDTGSKNVTNAMRTVRYNGGGNYNDISMGSNHANGCNVAFGDGSVRSLRDSLDLNRVLKPMASRNGGEVIQE